MRLFLQVVFTVGVNLQGVFIFAFHCARPKVVRDSWRSSLFSGWTATRSSSSLPASSLPRSKDTPLTGSGSGSPTHPAPPTEGSTRSRDSDVKHRALDTRV